MGAELWVTLIIGVATPLCTLLGVILANKKANKQQSTNIEGYKNLTLYRIDQLEKKVELHNNAVERLFIAEGNIKELQHEVRDLKDDR